MTEPDSDWTEAVDADIPRVDLVGRAANGVPGFLVMKQDAQGLLDADYVRNLITKSEPQNESKETVTMTGSPGAIAKLIHEAAGINAVPEPTTAVSKGLDLDESTDGLDVTMPLAAPDEDAPGDPNIPGSPAWEAIDAATARKWTSVLARAKVAVDMLAEREMLEAATGDEDDLDNAWDLQDACCAIDYAISVLAPFAVDEQSEADCGEMMQAVGKALAAFDPAPLDTIEALGQVRKAGRVLSAGNEAAIRGAVESLQKVLASLPAAPTTEDGQSVAKEEETDMPEPTHVEDTIAEAGEQPKMGIAKADGEKTPMVVVYDQKGRLIGIVDPTDVTPVANSEADADDMDDATEPATPEAADLTPAPAAEAGTPADAVPDDDTVTKQTTDTDMFKSIAKDEATAALDAYSATQEQVIAKQAADLAQLADTVEKLTGLVKALEEQPATPKVFTNGAVPPRDLRGMDHGAQPADLARAQALRKSLYSGADAGEQNQAALDMQSMAIARLQEIHQGR